MPLYDVRGPNGRIYKVEAPEGTPAEQIKAAARYQYLSDTTPEEDTSGFKAAASAELKRMYGEAALTAGKAGLLSPERAQQIYKEQSAAAEQRHKPTEKGWTEDPWLKLKELAGGSAAGMIAPLAAGVGATAAAAAIPVVAPAAGIIGALGAGLASAGQFTGSNIASQMDTGKTFEEASGAKAALTAIPQAALDALSLRMVPGLGRLLGAAGKEVTEEGAKALANQTLKQIALDYSASTLKTMTFEGLTEAAQQALERAQAGLSITDEDARKEYFDQFLGGAILGGVLAGPGRAFERGEIKSKGRELEQARLGKEREAAAAEQARIDAETAAAKQQPEYLDNLITQYDTLSKQLADTPKPKKPKNATPDELYDYNQAKAARDELVAQMQPVDKEYTERLPEIRKRRAEVQAELETGQKAIPGLEAPPVPATDEQQLVNLTQQRDLLTQRQAQLDQRLEQTKDQPQAQQGLLQQRTIVQQQLDNVTAALEKVAPPPAQTPMQQRVDLSQQRDALMSNIAQIRKQAMEPGLEPQQMRGMLQQAAQLNQAVSTLDKQLKKLGGPVESLDKLQADRDLFVTKLEAAKKAAQKANKTEEAFPAVTKLLGKISEIDEKIALYKPAEGPQATLAFEPTAQERAAEQQARTGRAQQEALEGGAGPMQQTLIPGLETPPSPATTEQKIAALTQRKEQLTQRLEQAKDQPELQPQLQQQLAGVTSELERITPAAAPTAFDTQEEARKLSLMADRKEAQVKQQEAVADSFDDKAAAAPIEAYAEVRKAAVAERQKAEKMRQEVDAMRQQVEELRAQAPAAPAALIKRLQRTPTFADVDRTNIDTKLEQTKRRFENAKKVGDFEKAATEQANFLKLQEKRAAFSQADLEQGAAALQAYETALAEKIAAGREQSVERQRQANIAMAKAKADIQALLGQSETAPLVQEARVAKQRDIQQQQREIAQFEVEAPSAVTPQLPAVNIQDDLRQTIQDIERYESESPSVFASADDDARATALFNSITQSRKAAEQRAAEALEAAKRVPTRGLPPLNTAVERAAAAEKAAPAVEAKATPVAEKAAPAPAPVTTAAKKKAAPTQVPQAPVAQPKAAKPAATTTGKVSEEELRALRKAAREENAALKQKAEEYVAFGRKLKAASSESGSLRSFINPALQNAIRTGNTNKVLAVLEKSKNQIASWLATQARSIPTLKFKIDNNAAEYTVGRLDERLTNAKIALAELDKLREVAKTLPSTLSSDATISSDVLETTVEINGKKEKLNPAGRASTVTFKKFKGLLEAQERAFQDREAFYRRMVESQEKRHAISGIYDSSTNTIRVVDDYTGARSEGTVAHEIAHALTLKALDKPTAAQRPVVEKMQSLFEHVKQQEVFKDLYGATDIKEFVAEGFSNPFFQFQLSKIPYKNTTAWGKFTEYVANLLGIKADNAFTEFLTLGESIVSGKEKAVIKPGEKPAASLVRDTVEKVEKQMAEEAQAKPSRYEPRPTTPITDAVREAVEEGRSLDVVKSLLESKNPMIRTLAENMLRMMDSVKRVPKLLVQDNLEHEGKPAEGLYFDKSNRVVMDRASLTEEALAHEYSHAVTLTAIREFQKNPDSAVLTDAQKAAARKLQRLYDNIKEHEAFRREYGKESLEEFVSEVLSNESLRSKLDTHMTGTFKKIITAIMNLLGIDTRSLSSEAFDTALTLFQPPAAVSRNVQSAPVASIVRGKFFDKKPQASAAVPADVVDTVNSIVGKNGNAGGSQTASALGLLVRQKMVDNWASPEALIKKGVAEGKVSYTQALQMRTLMRVHNDTNRLTATAIKNGGLQLAKDKETGALTFNAAKAPGAFEMSAELAKSKLGDAQFVENLFTNWLAILRAERENVGYDKLNLPEKLNSQKAAAIKDLVNSDPATKEAFENARKIYHAYNRNLLDLLVKSGVMSQKKANELIAGDYVPFYRVVDGIAELHVGTKRVTIGSVIDQPQIKELVGGDQQILPVFSSMVQNTSLLITAAVRNMQVRDFGNIMQDMGLAQVIPKAGPKNDIHTARFRYKGEDYHVRLDPDAFPENIPADLVIAGLQGIKTAVPTAVRLMGLPARLLRKGVTRMPTYLVRQLIRDPVHNWLTTGGDFSMVRDTYKEFFSTLKKPTETVKLLEESGAVSSMVQTGDKEDLARVLRDIQSSGGGSKLNSALSWLDQKAMDVDASTRAAVYNEFRKKGAPHLEALLAAAEAMNFSRRGTSTSMYWMSAMVPFFNAQVQGIDSVYRAFKGDTAFESRMNAANKLRKRLVLMAVMTAGYAFAMQDDEAYKNATEMERASSFFLPIPGVGTLRVPIPYELGFLGKSLPELAFNTAFGDTKLRDARSTLEKLVQATSPFDLPLAVKPIYELRANHSFYTDAPIEAAREQALQSSERYRTYTPELIKLLGLGPLSPLQVEHLVRSYTGGVGMLVMTIPDILLRPLRAPEGVETPARRLSELPMLSSLFQPETGRGIIDSVYKDIEGYQQAANTYKTLRGQDAADFANKYANEIGMASVGGGFRQKMGELAQVRRQITAAPNISAEDKQKYIEEIKKLEIQLANQIRQVAASMERR